MRTMFNKFLGIMLVWLTVFPSVAQVLSYDLLTGMLSSSDWQDANTKIKAQGWKFVKIKDEKRISWAYEQSEYNPDRATAWCSADIVNGKIEYVSYITDEDVFKKITNGLIKRGYKKSKSFIDNETIVTDYSNNKYIFTLKEKSANQESEDHNQYIIEIVNYGGPYDPLNGEKITYSGSDKIVYHLKNGEYHGIYTAYDSLGNLKAKGNIVKGEKDGEWMYYDSNKKEVYTYKATGNNIKEYKEGKYECYIDDKLFATGAYKADKQSGEWIRYAGKRKIFTETYDESGKNFTVVFFDENGTVTFEGQGIRDVFNNTVPTGEYKIYENGKQVGTRIYKCSSSKEGVRKNYVEKREYKELTESGSLWCIENLVKNYIAKNSFNVYMLETRVDEEEIGEVKSTNILYRDGVKIAYADSLLTEIFYQDGKNFCRVDKQNNKLVVNESNGNIIKVDIKDDVVNVSIINNGVSYAEGSYYMSDKSDVQYPSLPLITSVLKLYGSKQWNLVKKGEWKYNNAGIRELYLEGQLTGIKHKDYSISFSDDGTFTKFSNDSISMTDKSVFIMHNSGYKTRIESQKKFVGKSADFVSLDGNEYHTVKMSFVEIFKQKIVTDDVDVIVYDKSGMEVVKGNTINGEFIIENRYDYKNNMVMTIDHNTGQESFVFIDNGQPSDGKFECYNKYDGNLIELIEVKNGLRHGVTTYYNVGMEVGKEKYRKGQKKE